MKAIYLWSACWCDKKITDEINLDSTIVIYDEDEYLIAPEYIDELKKKDRAFPTSSPSYIHKNEKLLAYNGLCYEEIINKIVNDFRLFQLYSRFNRFDTNSSFSFICKCNDAVAYTLEFLDKYEVTEILCMYTPHTFESFTFIKTLEICGVIVRRLSASPLPWLVYSLNGLENISVNQFRKIGMIDKDKANSRVEMYFNHLNSSYKDVIPWYEQNKQFSFKTLLYSTPLFNLKKFVKWILKQKVRKEMNLYISDIGTESRYGIYFLHVQPEANTMPEAGIYFDQFQLIKKLSDAMPSDISLLVKEHPSTFRDFDYRYRPKGFYKRLSEIRNVKICPIDSPTFSLIDNSKFVASISGMCMSEALARSIPIISFNPVRFNNFPKNAVIDGFSANIKSLSEQLNALLEDTYTFPEKEVFLSFVDLESFGYISALDENVIPNSRVHQLDMSLNASRKAVIDF